MPQKVFNQIQYLCQQIAKVEWSGILFYKTEGTIADPSNYKIILEDILPLHKGTATYTEYTFDERVVEYLMENEHLEECKMGHIHSHNTMAVFFSGTDWSELEDNAPNHNYYLSLIVNNFMDFCAKVCFVAKAQNETFKFEARDENGEKYIAQSGEYSVDPKLIVYDCEIESPKKVIEVQEEFVGKVKTIIEKAAAVTTTTVNSSTSRNFQNLGENKLNFQEEREQHWTSRETTMADAIEDFAEEFTMFVINTGNSTEEFNDIEDICEMYEASRITGKMLAGNVVSTYTESYAKFFEMFKQELANPDMFHKATEEVIWELEHTIQTTKRPLVKAMLEPSCEVIKQILRNFNQKINA